MRKCVMKTVTVNAEALQALLVAVNGPSHYIRELQVTRDLPAGMSDDNPLNILTKEFNEQVEAYKKGHS